MDRYDVIVIGAGLVGCATAFHLSRSGANVLVVESGVPNDGASGRNAGSLHFQLEPRMMDALHSDPTQLGKLVPINLAAQKDWSDLSSLLETDIGAVMHGGLMIAETQFDTDVLREKVSLEQQWGLMSRLIEKDEIRSIAPYLAESVLAAAYLETEGHANPRLVTPAFVNQAVRFGAKFITHTSAVAMKQQSDNWQVELRSTGYSGPEAHATCSAKVVLLAAGAWNSSLLKILGVGLPLSPLGLIMNVTERTKPVIGHLIQHVGKRLSLKQSGDGNILIGGGWPARLRWNEGLGERSYADVDLSNVYDNLNVAGYVFPGLRDLHLLRTWTGIASDTPDHLPLLGPVPGHSNCFVVGGGSSFTLGPTLSRLMANIIEGKQPDLYVDIYCPSRFI